MKKYVCLSAVLFLFFALSFSVFAGPMFPGPHNGVQPTGETFVYYATGDEYWHFIRSSEGYVLAKDANGFYCYAVRGQYVFAPEYLQPPGYRRGGYSYTASDVKYMIDPLPKTVWVGTAEYSEPRAKNTTRAQQNQMDELILREQERLSGTSRPANPVPTTTLTEVTTVTTTATSTTRATTLKPADPVTTVAPTQVTTVKTTAPSTARTTTRTDIINDAILSTTSTTAAPTVTTTIKDTPSVTDDPGSTPPAEPPAVTVQKPGPATSAATMPLPVAELIPENIAPGGTHPMIYVSIALGSIGILGGTVFLLIKKGVIRLNKFD
ncbi:MAG: hypothetical protein FWE80_01030 [Oscillospiraceae bacterium]|nr:hypothetical protein [Oscillospiraceae bacterium]